MSIRKDLAIVAFLCAALAVAAILLRPALPIDETRYLSVAWEMFLNHNYFLPTLNFAPYHHKPPLLFWLINLSWEIFGAERWPAVLTVSIISSAGIFLLYKIIGILFPRENAIQERAPWIMVASFPFLAMGTAIMFDFTLTFCVLLCWLFAAKFLTTHKFAWVVPAGLAMGLGVLAKGPVVLLFTLLPLLLTPFWHKDISSKKKHYLGLLTMFVVGLGPVMIWLVPVYLGTSAEFFQWLVFKQTTSRMTGSFGGAHARPVYFYAPYFLALFMPWLLLPNFWCHLKEIKSQLKSDDVLCFCAFTVLPALIVFTISSGKQAHYLIPLTPFVVILIAKLLETMPLNHVKQLSMTMVALMVAGQAFASITFFPSYDMTEVAKIVAAHPDRDWAYVRNYHGEVNFLAKRDKPVEGLPELEDLPEWFGRHPGGMAIVRYRDERDVQAYKSLYTKDYSKDKKLSVIELMPETP